MNAARSRALVAWGLRGALLLVAVACSGPATGGQPAPVNPVRLLLEKQIAGLAADGPLQLRYNPATCDCPVFELRLESSWIRAHWRNQAAAEFEPVVRSLIALAADRWPVPLSLKGQVDPEVLRTPVGQYAVQFTASEVIQAPPPAPPAAVAPPPPLPKASAPSGEAEVPPS